MFFTCKCGQKLNINNPPQKKLKVICPKCLSENIFDNSGTVKFYDFVSSYYKSPDLELTSKTQKATLSNNQTNKDKDVCFICNKTCIESNLLQNGMRYHQECLDNLKSQETIFDERIRNAENSLHTMKSQINKAYRQRGFIQKIFSVVPDSIDDLIKQENNLKEKIYSLKKQKNELLINRDNELRKVYDYWLTKPPDWYDRSVELRQRIKYCMNCGKPAKKGNPLHVHHIIPVSHGGNHKVKNLEVLCLKCHQKEHPFKINQGFQGNFSPSNQSNRYSDLIDKIEKSKKESLYISFKYRRFEGVRDKHLVLAEKLISKEGGMYFTGFCYLSNTSRDFKLKNMYKIEIKDSLPGSRLPADYIEEAFERNLMIHCHYTKRTGGKSVRTLKPIGYTTFHGVNVIECFDYLTEENRCFAPHRMDKIELVKEPKESKVITGQP
jgi:5-methylcytosine-specific restriction endonuclease McrA